MREISKAEEKICSQLGPVLAASPVQSNLQEAEGFAEVLVGLEWFLPEVFRELHKEWKGEGLDGIYPAVARKTGERELEIIGVCCLLRDQTVAPLHLRLQIARDGNTISWLECRLGEDMGNGMRRVPYNSAASQGSMLHVLKRLDSIDWFYRVGYGDYEEEKKPT